MYQKIWTDYLSTLKESPRERTLFLGLALRLIREEIRKSRTAVAQESKVGLSLLKAMETKREAYSTWTNVVNLARSLNRPAGKLIERGREEFPNNFFVQRKESRPHLDYAGAIVYPLSAPFSAPSDFLWMKIILAPGKQFGPCSHPGSREIACYVSEGPLQFQFAGETHELKANQSFFFDGSAPHGFFNQNPDKSIEFFLCVNPPPAQNPLTPIPSPRRGEGKGEGRLDLAYALEYARRKASPAPNILLPWNMLSDMTGIPMRALMHLKSGKSEIVYWDKLEALARGTGIGLDEILGVAMGTTPGRFEICHALHRGYLDYGDPFGLKIYSAVRPGTSRRKFFIGQVFLNRRASAAGMRRRWRYKTNAMIGIIVQDGRILVEYGERKKEKLATGDSVYFDASLEFVIHNLEHQESKLFLFSHPPLF